MRDDLRQIRELRIHFIKGGLQAQSVGLGHGKDDRLPRQLPRRIFLARIPDLFPLLADGIAIADGRFQFRAFVVDVVGVESLFDQRVALLLGQVHAVNTLPLELGPRGVEFIIHEILVFDGLFVGIEIGRLAVRAIEGKEGIAVM